MSALHDENIEIPTSSRHLRILVATEYLPPYVSGIANRCKNLIKGYRDQGHEVIVASVAGTACDMVVPSIPNPVYMQQRAFVFPPLLLLWQLLNFTQPVPYDIVHIVGPPAWPFALLNPLFKLRGVSIYVSYHVLMEFYFDLYFPIWLRAWILPIFYVVYLWPLVWFADMVGIPSDTADSFVLKYSKKIHYMKSGIDTDVFVPLAKAQTAAPAAPVANRISEKQQMENAFRVLTNGKAEEAETDRTFDEEPCPPHPDHQTRSRSSSPPPPHDAHDTVPAYSTADPAVSSLPNVAGPVLVYVGRLAAEKNIEFLVAAMSHPLLHDCTLVIVGDGPCRAGLEQLAIQTVGADNVFASGAGGKSDRHTSNLAVHVARGTANYNSPLVDSSANTSTTTGPRVVFTGMLLSEHAVRAHYAKSSIFITASASETFGFTVAEAMACGTPAVCVRSGAFPKVYSMIDDWMFNEGDVEGYVKCLREVLAQGDKARQRARRIVVQKFSIKMAVGDLLMAYEECVNSKEKKDL